MAHKKHMAKKMRADKINKIIFALVVVLVALIVFFVVEAKYFGFVPLEISSFNDQIGSCVDCSMDGSLEITNIHSSAEDTGLIAYWQFSSIENESFVDLVAGRALTGSAVKRHERVIFNGGDLLNVGCEGRCGGTPKVEGCGIWGSKESCEAFGGHSGCSWSDVCSGELVCDDQKDSESCAGIKGCSWGGTNCYGTPAYNCGIWSTDSIGCSAFNSHSGDCTWNNPCKGYISCNKFKNERECSINAGCLWIGSTSANGYCEGGVSSCSQWDNDLAGCASSDYHAGQCSWDGPCKGLLSCEGQIDSKSCEAVPGCTFKSDFPVSGDGSWSVFAWVRTKGNKVDKTLFGMGDADSVRRGAYVRVNGDGKIYLDFGGQIVGTDIRVADNTWHYVGAVYDGTTAKVYVDGKKAGEISIILNLQCSGFTVGSGSGASNFEGDLDEIKIYDIPLSESDVLKLYNVGLFRSQAEFVSRVYDLGVESAITSANWDSSGINSKAVIQFRVSSDNGTWSDWSRAYSQPGSLNLQYGRYIQYRVGLQTKDLTESPVFNSLSLDYQSKSSSLIFAEPSDVGKISKNSIAVNLVTPEIGNGRDNFEISLYNSQGLVKTIESDTPVASFDGLPEGRYTIEASSPGLSSVSRTIVISSKPEKSGKIKVPVEGAGESIIVGSEENKQLIQTPITADENPVRGFIRTLAESVG
jgi:hypothetical protein